MLIAESRRAPVNLEWFWFTNILMVVRTWCVCVMRVRTFLRPNVSLARWAGEVHLSSRRSEGEERGSSGFIGLVTSWVLRHTVTNSSQKGFTAIGEKMKDIGRLRCGSSPLSSEQRRHVVAGVGSKCRPQIVGPNRIKAVNWTRKPLTWCIPQNIKVGLSQWHIFWDNIFSQKLLL